MPDKIFVPIHHLDHWLLGCVDLKVKTVKLYDSSLKTYAKKRKLLGEVSSLLDTTWNILIKVSYAAVETFWGVPIEYNSDIRLRKAHSPCYLYRSQFIWGY